MQENVKKCKNFLATLIKLASHNSPSPETSKNVKALVQDLLVSIYLVIYVYDEKQFNIIYLYLVALIILQKYLKILIGFSSFCRFEMHNTKV